MVFLVEIKSFSHAYEVSLGSNIEEMITSFDDDCCFLIDKSIAKNKYDFLKKIAENKIVYFEAIEQNKSLTSIDVLANEFLRLKIRKNSNLVCIGGGIIHDVGGFLASVLFRQISWTFIPTTFPAQIDTCVGGKNGVNLEHGKNMIGRIYPPKKVYIDINFLNTLTNEDLYSGIGEYIKHVLIDYSNTGKIAVEDLSLLFEKETKTLMKCVEFSLNLKKKFVEQDEFDQNERQLLNFGHCIGHAFESASYYKIKHGVAVLIGLLAANRISFNRSYLKKDIVEVFENQLIVPVLKKLDMTIISRIKKEKIIEYIKLDKKRVKNQLTIIAFNKDCCLEKLENIENSEVESALDYVYRIL